MQKGMITNTFLMPILAIIGSVLVAILLTVDIPSVMAAKKPMEKAFPSSEKCKRCHLRVFEEWEASAQSRSIVTAPFRITLERYLAKAKRSPHGWSRVPTMSLDSFSGC
jgi:hypothetical protein